MSKIASIKAGHGLSGSGLAHPLEKGCVGPESSFTGRTMPQDTGRTANPSGIEVGEVGSKKVPANVGMGKHKTGGMSRLKGASGVGPFKAKGTT